MTTGATSQQRTSSATVPTDALAAVIDAPRHVSLQKVRLEPLLANEVRIRLQGCGICGSNLPMWQGRAWFDYPAQPGAPGHEGWGIVDAVGTDVRQVSPGDRVAALSYHAFATHDTASEDQVVKLPASLDDMPVPGEPLGCAMNVFERSRIQSGQCVAVVGVGFLGALVIQLARAAGARVFGISRRPYSRKVATSCGAELVMDVDRAAAEQRLSEATGGEGCDCVIEATGLQEPLDLASSLVKTRGRLVVAGFHQDGPRSVDMQSWNWRGIDVINAHERDPQMYIQGIRRAVAAMEEGRLRVGELLTHEYPLSQLNVALDLSDARPSGFLKSWVRCDER